jgi:Predicted peptidase
MQRQAQGLPVAEAAAESEWLVAGPFDAKGANALEDGLDRDFLAAEGGEAKSAPGRVRAASDKLWREAQKTPRGFGGVDFIAEFGQVEDKVAYAYREVESPADRVLALRLGSDDGAKVWINGELALANHAKRSLTADEDEVFVSVEAGSNRVLVKIGQAGGAWGFKLRLVPKELDEAAAPAKVAIGALTDSLSYPLGSAITGVVMSHPAAHASRAAKVELLDGFGAVIAEVEAKIGGRFAVAPPGGFSGMAYLRVRAFGDEERTPVIVGDAAALAREAVALARNAAASRSGGDGDTLEYLADCIEGKRSAQELGAMNGFAAYAQARAMLSPGAGGAYPAGLWRYAYRSQADGSIQPYSLYLPPGYAKDRRYGLVVSLHGSGGNDYDQASLLAAARPEDMLVLAPYGRGNSSYLGLGERDVLDTLDLVMARYAIDPDRVYLTGSSMGGYGSWRLAKLYPWRFAAVAPFAGWTSLDYLENLASLPLLAVHGDADAVVPLGPDRQAVEFLGSIGGKARLEILPGVGHDAFGAWTAKEGPERLLAWFRGAMREAWPRALGIRASAAKTGRGSWAAILGAQEGSAQAALEARVAGDRSVVVDTENVAAFSLDLRHPLLAKGGRVLVTIDGRSTTADSGKANALFELDGSGRFKSVPPNAMPTVANSGEGFGALVGTRLLIIYGGGKRSTRGANEGLAAALGKMLSAQVVSDEEAMRAGSEGGEGALPKPLRVFVGTTEDNAALKQMAAALPFEWKDGSCTLRDTDVPAGRGIALVCPDPEFQGSLMGILALPLSKGEAVSWAGEIARKLGIVSDEGGVRGPEIAILGTKGDAIWSGYFDWRWEKISGKAAQR